MSPRKKTFFVNIRVWIIYLKKRLLLHIFAAIDWIPLGEEKLALLSDPKQNTITISGGCKVTMNQRKGLDLFLKYGHVTKW